MLSLTHSTFETNIWEIARVAALVRGTPVPEKALPIWRAKDFLEKDCKVDCSDDGWVQLKAYQTVRNAFIHNDGRTDLPLNDGSDVLAAARLLGIEVKDDRMVLTRDGAAAFVALGRRLCLFVLGRAGGGLY